MFKSVLKRLKMDFKRMFIAVVDHDMTAYWNNLKQKR